MFNHVVYYPGDPILSLVDAYRNDPRPEKINLGIGVYCDENGKMPILQCIQQAEAERTANPRPSTYLPMEGMSALRTTIQHLLFGADCPAVVEKRVATVQTLGGSGALKLGADFIRKWFPQSKVYVSDPTWDNHRGIFQAAGIKVGTYPYYDSATISVRFDDMLAFFQTLPEKTVLLLHPCCHNPTGVDLTPEQWDSVLAVVAERGLIPFMDIAYQGFGGSLEEDVYAIRKAVALNLPLFVSNSFSKNLSLYGERIGGLSVVCPSEREAELVLGQMKFIVRCIYSSPPSHGAQLVQSVLGNPERTALWQQEVYAMRDRIRAMRSKLHSVLSATLPGRNFDYFIRQRGMFSYTGLTVEQVDRLREESAVYLLASGRMCIAGLNDGNVEYVAQSIAKVLK